MPTEWSEGILLSELADEPELSEELAALFARLKGEPGAGGPDSGVDPPKRAPTAGQDAQFEPPNVVLNFAGVSYLNSSHIAALLRMRKLLGEAGKAFVLCAMTPEVWSMIRLTGLDKIFKFAPDTMTGLAMVQLTDEGKK